jgi:tetratricopeptide (TPR) repeat protein
MIAGRYGAGVRGARERLGRHLLEAGAFDEAIEPLLEAAAERCQSADFDRAQAILDERDRALDAIGAEPNASARLAGDIERMRALARKGDPEGAAALASRIEMLTDGDPRYAVMYGDIERMRALFAHKAGETTTSLARYREAISHYRVAGDQPGIGRSLHGLAEVHAVRGEMEEAETRYREALEAIQPTDDLQYRAHAMIGLGNVVRQRGRFDEGAALIDGAMKMYRQIGDRLGEAMSANYLGELARQRGDLAAAEAHYQEAAEGTRAVGTRDALIIELNLCLVRIARGAYDRARSVLLATLAELDDAGLSGFAAFAHSALVACAAAKGDWEAFDLHVDRAERILAASRIVDDDVAWPIELAARLAGEAGQAERATRAGAIGAAQRKALAGGT